MNGTLIWLGLLMCASGAVVACGKSVRFLALDAPALWGVGAWNFYVGLSHPSTLGQLIAYLGIAQMLWGFQAAYYAVRFCWGPSKGPDPKNLERIEALQKQVAAADATADPSLIEFVVPSGRDDSSTWVRALLAEQGAVVVVANAFPTKTPASLSFARRACCSSNLDIERTIYFDGNGFSVLDISPEMRRRWEVWKFGAVGADASRPKASRKVRRWAATLKYSLAAFAVMHLAAVAVVLSWREAIRVDIPNAIGVVTFSLLGLAFLAVIVSSTWLTEAVKGKRYDALWPTVGLLLGGLFTYGLIVYIVVFVKLWAARRRLAELDA